MGWQVAPVLWGGVVGRPGLGVEGTADGVAEAPLAHAATASPRAAASGAKTNVTPSAWQAVRARRRNPSTGPMAIIERLQA